jgi:hypothetical protein
MEEEQERRDENPVSRRTRGVGDRRGVGGKGAGKEPVKEEGKVAELERRRRAFNKNFGGDLGEGERYVLNNIVAEAEGKEKEEEKVKREKRAKKEKDPLLGKTIEHVFEEAGEQDEWMRGTVTGVVKGKREIAEGLTHNVRYRKKDNDGEFGGVFAHRLTADREGKYWRLVK